MRRTAAVMAATVLCAVLTACGSNPNRPPTGVSAQQSLAAQGGLASAAGGTCKLVTAAAIEQSLGGRVGKPQPDVLTPGLDKCTWHITGSSLGDSLQLIAYRLSSRTAKRTWTKANLTLMTPRSSTSLGLQILTTSKVDADAIHTALDSLADQVGPR